MLSAETETSFQVVIANSANYTRTCLSWSYTWLLYVEESAKEEKPAASQVADGEVKPDSGASAEDTDMAAADAAADAPPKEAEPKTNSPTKTDYQMSVKTDEKSAAVSDSQAGDASTHEATTEVKAAAQVKEGSSEGSKPEDVGKLDIHLTYLWEVHRVNFYVGGDLHTVIVNLVHKLDICQQSSRCGFELCIPCVMQLQSVVT